MRKLVCTECRWFERDSGRFGEVLPRMLACPRCGTVGSIRDACEREGCWRVATHEDAQHQHPTCDVHYTETT